MATKSSIHIKPCNIASSEAHNRRTAEYMRHIGESRTYVVPELSTDNEQWINPDFGSPDLRMHYDNIRQMVKEKTGRGCFLICMYDDVKRICTCSPDVCCDGVSITAAL